jgi:hypothetical protein
MESRPFRDRPRRDKGLAVFREIFRGRILRAETGGEGGGSTEGKSGKEVTSFQVHGAMHCRNSPREFN